MKIIMMFIPILAMALEPTLVSQTKSATESNKIFSDNKEYFGVIEYGEGNSEFVPIVSFTLHNTEGIVLYKKTDFGHTLADIANNGAIVGIDFDGPISGKAVLNFYDEKGTMTGSASVGFLLERYFSTSSNVYCVNDGVNGVRVFNPSGKELYNLGKANWFAVSDNGEIVALVRDAEIVLFAQGNEIGMIPISSSFIRQAGLSRDGALLCYIDRKNIYLYSVQELTLLYHYQEENPELNFISVDISNNNSFILAGLDKDKGRGEPERHTAGLVYLLDADGVLQWQKEIKYSDWNVYTPKVSFTSDNTFEVRTMDELYEFKY